MYNNNVHDLQKVVIKKGLTDFTKIQIYVNVVAGTKVVTTKKGNYGGSLCLPEGFFSFK